MEKRDILVTREEIKEFKKKYGFSRVELIPIFNQGPYTLDNFEYGRKETLDNQEFVRELIDDENKLKERVQSLYDEGKIIFKIYVKVFRENKIINKEEKYYLKKVDKDVVKRINEFQEKYNICDSYLAKILGVSSYKLNEIKNYGFIKETREQFIKDVLKDKESTIKEIENKIKRGSISKGTGENLIDNIIIISRKHEGKTERNVKDRRRYNKKENRPEYIIKIDEKVSEENKNAECKSKNNSRINKLRKEAIKELQSELDGKTTSYNKRETFFEDIYTMYEKNMPIEIEDIDVVKSTVLMHHEFISNYSLKLIVLGTLKSKGYGVARQYINELILKVKEIEYKEKLIKYREILQIEYAKKMIKNMEANGYKKEDIRKKLGLTNFQINTIMEDSNERI